ncbi:MULTISPECIES: phosphate signaling complex protein PhoU [Bacillaceae]|jgi:phosphate transport system protein|uniref:Phosphate signaling complex protein PhoU n=1 Tax=Rossellomorea vietnamensis TaxID=218284 RepID=A0ACD4C9W8_9BACI|nr:MULTISPECIES: phosphate signaling complex protein PhoU [Bacillaceae]OXS62952.1 phosphate transport system regulatory protein PhoU [Bacillus sp. DSM 27956]PRX77790.1 phosphate transport system protein [Bacillus sp. V-88]MCA0147603.1 phosphate signaling complex protein PhoU [Rossellomorea vietnamensis]MCC5800194.1 phosphate signaling complex protein PhoU [Rossellomorea vietnamensis]PFG05702.1 phosphate transport system protein [Bacillus sp. es.034]
MAIRRNFDNNLKELKDKLFDMADLAKVSLKESVVALKTQDIEKAEEIIKKDHIINQYDNEINNLAIILIAKESPVATDLRKIISALRICSEIERIGDMATNIAKSTLHIGNQKLIKPIEEIPRMLSIAEEMLEEALTAFYSEDASLAKKVADRDDEVDELYGKLVKELMTYIPNYPNEISQITQLAFTCRYIERVADHVTNICENVIFLVTGERFDLNN